MKQPKQHTRSHIAMSQLVYVPGMPAESLRYYATDSVQNTLMQPMTILYPAATSDTHSISTPPLPAVQQPPFSPNRGSYYVCQNLPMEVNRHSKVVYLLPSTPPQSGGPMSVFIQPSNSSCSSFVVNQPYVGQEVYTAAQVMAPPSQTPQQHQVACAPMSHSATAKPPQPLIDPATKLALLRSPEVCRHYLNGRCNRRKCRFLHPDLHHPVEPTMMTYIATEPATPAVSTGPPREQSLIVNEQLHDWGAGELDSSARLKPQQNCIRTKKLSCIV